MTFIIPTTQEIKDQIQTNIELATNNVLSIFPKSFTQFLSTALALSISPIYKYITWTLKQRFALSCSEYNLEYYFGVEYKIPRIQRVKEEATVSVVAFENPEEIIITTDTVLICDRNGLIYYPKYTTIIPLPLIDYSVIHMQIIAETEGSEYNLEVDDILRFDPDIEYITNPIGLRGGMVDSIEIIGTDFEDLEVYRRRVLSKIASDGGGGNLTDYRRWAESVDGVLHAYPYSGRPMIPYEELPGDITIYIESDQPYGISNQTLLDYVKTEVINDPNTGIDRTRIGDIENTLFIESIIPIYFHVYIYDLYLGLNIEDSFIQKAKEAIEDELDSYFLEARPFIPGLDLFYNRRDIVSRASISGSIINSLKPFGGSISNIVVKLNGITEINEKQLIGGEIAIRAGIIYE